MRSHLGLMTTDPYLREHIRRSAEQQVLADKLREGLANARAMAEERGAKVVLVRFGRACWTVATMSSPSAMREGWYEDGDERHELDASLGDRMMAVDTEPPIDGVCGTRTESD